MTYEKYVGQRPRGTKNIVSIRTNGQIAFNSRASQSFKLSNYQYAYLMFDRGKDVVGIELSNEKRKGARKILVLSGAVVISGAAFFNHFDIIIEKAIKREPDYDENERLITFSL